jgi:hypothetical protein
MATNATKYYNAYVASHTDRFQKFRDEAYNELMLTFKDDIAYKKILQDREEALLRSIRDLSKSKTGDPTLDLGIIRLQLAANAQIQNGLEDGRDARLRILKEKGGLQVPKTSNDKIIELNQALATSGALTSDPAVVNQIVNSGIEAITSSVAAGGRPAAATGQKAWEALSSSIAFDKLSRDQQLAAKDKLVAELGLDAVNLGGASGATLLDVAQDVLVERETQLLLEKEGKAYGVSAAKSIFDKLDAAQEALNKGDKDGARSAIDEALKGAADTITPELKKVQEKLAEVRPELPSEAAVRLRAREKYAPEAAVFERKQFERDLIANDPEKLLHYDAIQAVKEGRIPLDDKAVTAAQMFINTYVPLNTSKAQRRKDAISKAVEFAGGDLKKRDQFLTAFHKIQMEGEDARTAPSEILPEPPRLVEPERLGDADKLPSRGELTGVDRAARLEEVRKDMSTRQRITDRMVELVKEKDALDKVGIANFTPDQEQKYEDLRAGIETLVTEYKKPQYDPAIFAAESADLRRALSPQYSKPLDQMLEAERLKLAERQQPDALPSGYDVPPRRVRTRIGDLPSMADLFSNELEALIPLSRQGGR